MYEKINDTTIVTTEKYAKPGDLYVGILIYNKNRYYIDLGYDKKLCYNVLIPVIENKKTNCNLQIYSNYNKNKK